MGISAAHGRETRRPLEGLISAVCPVAAAGCLALVVAAAKAAAPSLHAPSRSYLVYAGGAFACYALGLAVLRRRPARLLVVLALVGAIQLAPLAQPLILSRDAMTYWDYGRIAAIDGGNPYRDPPSRYPADPAYGAMASGWHDTTTAYGPLFTLVSEGGSLATGTSADSAAAFYKVLAAASVSVMAVLAALVSPRPAFAAAAVGWSPLFALHFAGGGHNDALMMVILLAAIALETRGRQRLSGALWACAAAVKWIPLLLLPIRAARDTSSRPRFGYGGFAAAAGFIALAAWLRYGTAWLSAVSPIVHDAASGSRESSVHLLRDVVGSKSTAAWIGVGLFAVAYAILFRRALRGRARLGLTACLLLVTTPWLLPWYAIWAVPLAAAEDDTPALWLAVAVSGYLLVGVSAY